MIDVTNVVQHVSASVRFIVADQSYTLSEFPVFDWVGVGIDGGPDSNELPAFMAMTRICIQAASLSGHPLNHLCPRSNGTGEASCQFRNLGPRVSFPCFVREWAEACR